MGDKFEEQFRAHAVHTSLASLEKILADSMLVEGASQFLGDLQRIQKTTILIRERLESADPELIPLSTLNSLNSPLVNILAQIENFLNNPDAQFINNAISYLDQAIALIPILSSFSVSQESLQYLSLSEAQLNSFTNALERQTNDFKKKLAELSNDYSAVLSNAESSRITSDATTKQSNDLITSLQTNSQTIISDLQNQNQNIISSIQQQFLEAQSKRSTTFDEFVSDYKIKSDSELDKLLDDHDQKIEKHFTKYNEKVHSIIEDSESKHARIIDLYQIVAGDSEGGEYAQTAQRELKTANILRILGISCLVCGIGWVFLCILASVGVPIVETDIMLNLSAYHAIPAATITIILLSISTYLLFQSEKHRVISLWAKQINLELKAFEPFIYSIGNEDVKIELRKALTSQLFGHINNPQNAKLKTETGLPVEKLFELWNKLPDALKNKIFP